MTVTIGIAAGAADQRWFWSLLVTQCEWNVQSWDTQGPRPPAPVAAWIALVPRPQEPPATQEEPRCLWLPQLSAPTLLLGTPLAVARAVSADLPVPHLLTTHALAILHLDLFIPMLVPGMVAPRGRLRSGVSELPVSSMVR